MNQIIFLFGGLLLGVIITAPIAMLLTRAGCAKELINATKNVEILQNENSTSQSRLKEVEEQSRVRIQEWNEERISYQQERNQLTEARLKAAESQARSEAEAIAARELAENAIQERDLIESDMEAVRDACDTLKIEIATQTARAEAAEQSKATALIEKQNNCDHILETARKAHNQQFKAYSLTSKCERANTRKPSSL